MTYKEKLKDFERLISPYITHISDHIEYLGFFCRIYFFGSETQRDFWRTDKHVLVLGDWGPTGLVVGVAWVPYKERSSDVVKQVGRYAKRHCPSMLTEPEWAMEALMIRRNNKRASTDETIPSL